MDLIDIHAETTDDMHHQDSILSVSASQLATYTTMMIHGWNLKCIISYVFVEISREIFLAWRWILSIMSKHKFREWPGATKHLAILGTNV